MVFKFMTLCDGFAPERVEKAEVRYSRQYGHSRSSGRHPTVFGCQTLTQLVDGSFGHPIADHSCRSGEHNIFDLVSSRSNSGCEHKGHLGGTGEPPSERNASETYEKQGCNAPWNGWNNLKRL